MKILILVIAVLAIISFLLPAIFPFYQIYLKKGEIGADSKFKTFLSLARFNYRSMFYKPSMAQAPVDQGSLDDWFNEENGMYATVENMGHTWQVSIESTKFQDETLFEFQLESALKDISIDQYNDVLMALRDFGQQLDGLSSEELGDEYTMLDISYAPNKGWHRFDRFDDDSADTMANFVGTLEKEVFNKKTILSIEGMFSESRLDFLKNKLQEIFGEQVVL